MTYRQDMELAHAVGRGDERAGAEFVRRHADRLYDFLFWRCGRDRAATEDLVQETMLAAVRSIGRYDGRAPLEAWLTGIARHCWSHWRRGRAVSDPVPDALDGEVRVEPAADAPDRAPLPSERLERQEVRDAVRAVLSGMPWDEALALEGRYQDDLPVERIAERLGRSTKAAESLLSRARRRFRATFVRVYAEWLK